MRIVHLANAYAPRSGGIRTTIHALGAGYRARGHELVLVAPGSTDSELGHAWGRLVTVRGPRVPFTAGYRAIVDRDRLIRTVERLEPDRLEVSDRFTLRPAGHWARCAGVPSLFFAHERLDGVLTTTARLPAGAARALADHHNRTTSRAFDTLVATTTYAALELERIGANVEHVPLGVDLGTFQPSGEPREAPTERVLVLCSRLSPEKRPDLAIDVVRELRNDPVPTRLVVAGDGPSRRALERRARGLPVTFLGHLADRSRVAALLADADAVLAPGPVETFGLAALEAMACGTPVVASSTSALAELVTDGAGALAAPTVAAMTAATRAVLAEPRVRTRALARRRAEQLPWSATVDRLLDLHAAARIAG